MFLIYSINLLFNNFLATHIYFGDICAFFMQIMTNDPQIWIIYDFG